MNTNGISNGNSVWQAILKVIDANKTADNKEALDSVKEQIKPFFEESQDAEVGLNLDDTSVTDVPKVDSKIIEYSKPITTTTYGENGEYTITTRPGAGIMGGSSKAITYNKDGLKLKEAVTSIGTDKPYTWTTIFDSDGKAISEIYSTDREGKNVEYKDIMKYDDSGIFIGRTRTYADGSVKELDKDGNEIKGSTDTPKVKEGEVGSKTYIENLLSSDNISGKFDTDDIKYDDKGRIISFTSYVRNNSNGHHEISYNDDGTITITRTDISPTSVRRFDKDGKEIKDSTDTPKVKDGEIGSLTYLKNLIKNFDESCSPMNYDAQGRIIFMFNGCNTDRGYHISYENNGDVTVVYSGFSTPKITSTYHKDGSYEEIVDYNFDFPSKNIIETKKFDKDGNEIKVSTPSETETPEATKEATPTVPKETVPTKPTMPTIPGGDGHGGPGSVFPRGRGSQGGSTVGGFESPWRSGFGSRLAYRLSNVWQQNFGNILGGIFSRSTTTFYNRMNGFLDDIFSRFNR